MEYVLALFVLVTLVALVVLSPLVRRGETLAREEGLRAELDAAKEAKYREIRDAELDLRMGKLSKADHQEVDRELRAEAMAILRKLDALEGRAPRG